MALCPYSSLTASGGSLTPSADRLRYPSLAELERLARRAGEVVMAVYATDFAVQGKADASPVTLADQQAEAVILAGLRALTPDVPIVAEEAMAAGQTPRLTPGGRFWLVDPLDGTREFVARNGEFTVNIALIEQGRPVLGRRGPQHDKTAFGARGSDDLIHNAIQDLVQVE